MRKRKFKDKAVQEVYDWFIANRPDPQGQHAQGACGNAYFVGRKFPHSTRPFAVRNSLAYAGWAAGVDIGKDMEKNEGRSGKAD